MVAAVRIHDAKVAVERNAPGGGLDICLTELAGYLRGGGQLPATWDTKRMVDTTAFRAAAMGK